MKKISISAIVVIVLLMVLRLCLPAILTWYVNRTLSQIPGYQGHVNNIGVSLWRGSYQIYGLKIEKTTGRVPVPFVAADILDFSLQWRELVHGALVGEITAVHPVLNFVKGPSEDESQTGLEEAAKEKNGDKFSKNKEASKDWRNVVKQLFPLRINHFQVKNGDVHFRDISSDPKVDVYLDQLEMMADNLTNSRKISKSLKASLKSSSRVMRRGHLFVNMQMDPYQKLPTFDMAIALRDLDLTDLNDFMRHYGDFDVRSGSIDVFSEVAASSGNIKGYVKPMIRNMNVVSLKHEPMTFRTAKKVVIEWVSDLFTNHKTKAVATKVEFSGRLDDPQSSIWSTLKYAFQNAFIKALSDKLEGDVSLKTVGDAGGEKKK